MAVTTSGSFGGSAVLESAKTANYTVLATDNGTLFTNAGAVGAVIFTLPAIAANLSFTFFVAADQSLTVASAAGDDMMVYNDIAADSVAFSTSSKKVGASLRVVANAAGTAWYCFPGTWNTATDGTTVTLATIAT